MSSETLGIQFGKGKAVFSSLSREGCMEMETQLRAGRPPRLPPLSTAQKASPRCCVCLPLLCLTPVSTGRGAEASPAPGQAMARQGRAGQGSSRPLGPAVAAATRGQRAGAGGRGLREEAEGKGRAGQGGTRGKKGEGGGASGRGRGGGLVDMRGASPRRPGGQRRASAGGGAAHTSPPCAGLQMCGGEREAGGEPPSVPPSLPQSLHPRPPALLRLRAGRGEPWARQPAANQPRPGQQVSSGLWRSACLPGMGGN